MVTKQHLSDEELVAIVRDQDQEKFAELVRRYEKKLVRYAQFLVNDHDMAIDIVQESFIKAFQNLRSFDQKKRFSPWMYRIVHNQAVNSIRSKRSIISIDLHQWVEDFFERPETPDEVYDKKEIAEGLKKKLDHLPVKYRSVLTLYYYEEKDYMEISEILRIPMNTVATWLRRGRNLLAKELTEKGGLHDTHTA